MYNEYEAPEAALQPQTAPRRPAVEAEFKPLGAAAVAAPFGAGLGLATLCVFPLMDLGARAEAGADIDPRQAAWLFACAAGLIFGAISLAVGVVFAYRALYLAWKRLQSYASARTTPGAALGRLFIPFYSFYWHFQAYQGFAIDYNRYRDSIGLGGKPMNVTLFKAVSWMPIVVAGANVASGQAHGIGAITVLAAALFLLQMLLGIFAAVALVRGHNQLGSHFADLAAKTENEQRSSNV